MKNKVSKIFSGKIKDTADCVCLQRMHLSGGIVGVYTLLTTEEIFRLVVSLIIFKRHKWMISLS